jgi:hypothetical protein
MSCRTISKHAAYICIVHYARGMHRTIYKTICIVLEACIAQPCNIYETAHAEAVSTAGTQEWMAPEVAFAADRGYSW